MKSVYLKNFLLLAGMVLLSFCVFMICFAVIVRSQTITEKRQSLEANATVIQNSYSYLEDVNPNNPANIGNVSLIASIMAMGSNHVTIANSAGQVVACSEYNCEHLYQSIPEELSLHLDEYAYYYTNNTSATALHTMYDSRSYLYAQSLVSEIYGIHGGYVLVSSSNDTVMKEWGAVVSLFLLVAASIFMLAIVIAMVTARHQATPLREMADAANKFGRGDFSARVTDVGRLDEIGELTKAFNAMAAGLERSENMRREFIGNVSHELKTPMTSITGFAEGILDGTIPPERQQEYLNIVASETKRLSRLVRRMLEVSQIQAKDVGQLHKNAFDITELLRRSVLSLETKITEKNLDVEMDLPDDPVMVLGEEDAIVQVVYNLLDNAIKFSYPETAIGVKLAQRSGKAYITIRNAGDCIPREELPLIFNRFHKSDKSRSSDKDGVGLGLYIVKTIINSHEEDIYVRSEDGVTEFMFTLTIKKKG